MILCLDTSSPIIHVFIVKDKEVIFQSNKRGRSQHLFDHLPSSMDEITQIIVGLGPGSFTGLRVGITFAKVFCSIKEIQLSGVHSLEALDNPDKLPVYARSRTGEIYSFDCEKKQISLIKDEDIQTPYIGPLLIESPNFDNIGLSLYSPNPFKMIEMSNFSIPWNSIRPYYTRGSYAEEKTMVNQN